MNTVNNVARDTASKMKAPVDTSQSTVQRLLRTPAVTAALPFINGGLAGEQTNIHLMHQC